MLLCNPSFLQASRTFRTPPDILSNPDVRALPDLADMKKTHDFYLTQRIIDFLMKSAAVILTSSATLTVADAAFSEMAGPWRWAIKIGALILVEGAFIASWLAIDTQRDAPMATKIAWSVTLVVIYGALLLLAIEHGEGMAGWAFRFVLAVMIGRSIYEAGVYEILKSSRKAERDIRNTFTYRRLHRLHAREDAIRNLNMESRHNNYARQMGAEINRAKIEAEHEAAMIDVELMRKRLLEQAHQKDTLQRQMQKHLHSLESKRQNAHRLPSHTRVAPIKQKLVLKRLTENPNRSIKTLSLLTRMTEEEVVAELRALEEAGVLNASAQNRSGYTFA